MTISFPQPLSPSELLAQLPTPDRLALFLDVDGTLIGLTHEDRDRGIPSSRRALVKQLHDLLGGALAVLSGRDLDQIDGVLPGLDLPAGGMQGLQRRTLAKGTRKVAELTDADRAVLEGLATVVTDRFPTVEVERKAGGGMTFVYHAPTPETQDVFELVQHELAGRLHVMKGVVAVDIMPHGANKGSALEDMLTEVPFEGRQPVHFGDDLPDESAFAMAMSRGGFGVSVGIARASAQFHLTSSETVWQVLQNYSEKYR